MYHEFLEDYLNDNNAHKKHSVSEFVEEGNVISVRYSYKYSNGEFGSYSEIALINIFDLIVFVYAQLKNK